MTVVLTSVRLVPCCLSASGAVGPISMRRHLLFLDAAITTIRNVYLNGNPVIRMCLFIGLIFFHTLFKELQQD